MSTRARQILIPENSVFDAVGIGFSDDRWNLIQSRIPADLSEEASIRLRNRATECCDQFLAAVRTIERGSVTAQSIKKGGGKQAAPLDQLERHLKSAADILGTIENMLDDRPGLLRRYQAQITAIAEDIGARKVALGKLRPTTINPKHELVRSLADACEGCGLEVTATHRIYDEKANRPTWFQDFVGALNDALLGVRGWGAADSDKRALYSDVLKALRERV